MIDTVMPESLGFEEKIEYLLKIRSEKTKAESNIVYNNPLEIKFTQKIIEDI